MVAKKSSSPNKQFSRKPNKPGPANYFPVDKAKPSKASKTKKAMCYPSI